MRTKINCDAVSILATEINQINDSIIKETKEAIYTLNEIKNVWKDYNSEKILNEMLTIVSTLSNVSKDINTMSNFCTKEILVKDDKNEQ